VSGTPSPAGLPAALVACAGSDGAALCPTTPLCWGDLVELDGRRAELGTTSCDSDHRWEAYAAGRPPAGAADVTPALPQVARVCTAARLHARTRPGTDTSRWSREVQPMTIPGYGGYFFCVAGTRTGPAATTPAFVTGP
jgi:hypothetical protein